MNNKHAYQGEKEFLGNMDDEPNVLYDDKLNQQIGKEIKKLRLETIFHKNSSENLLELKKIMSLC